jgi:hypothetical protein
VRFEVTATNTGTGDFTVTHPAQIRDDLTDVLDDATFDIGSVSAIVDGVPAGTMDIGGVPTGTGAVGALPIVTALAGTVHSPRDGVLRWVGPLAAGHTVVLRYSVTYTGEGNHSLVNRACVAEAAGEACAYATASGPAIAHTKKARPSGGVLKAGTVVTYTLHLFNAGDAAGVLDLVDPMGDVLDDTFWMSGPDVLPVRGAQDAVKDSVVKARMAGGVLSLTGRLGPHTSVDVVYQVKITHGGNGDVLNYLAERTIDGSLPPAPSRQRCVQGTAYPDNCVLLTLAAGKGGSGGGGSGGSGGSGRWPHPVETGLPPGVGLSVLVTLMLILGGAVTMTLARRPLKRGIRLRWSRQNKAVTR